MKNRDELTKTLPTTKPHISQQKWNRLRSLSTPDGIIAALAMDQRKSLRRMIAEAASLDLDRINDEMLADFKAAVSTVLSEHTSAILLDPEYGQSAFQAKSKNCGLLITYEADGYENPRPHRMLALMPHYSVRRLRDLGANGIKILLSYTPSGDPTANDEKCALIERIGHECEALDMPFFLEPVVYDPSGADPKGFEFAKQKPDLVVRTMEEFSKAIYKVDILKVEFPVNAAFVEGSAVYSGRAAYSMNDALDWFRAADRAARRPYIYLSAGISGPEFLESLQLAVRSGARFSGVLCGRANWQDGVPIFARSGKQAFIDWLRSTGIQNVQAVNQSLKQATPWHHWFQHPA